MVAFCPHTRKTLPFKKMANTGELTHFFFRFLFSTEFIKIDVKGYRMSVFFLCFFFSPYGFCLGTSEHEKYSSFTNAILFFRYNVFTENSRASLQRNPIERNVRYNEMFSVSIVINEMNFHHNEISLQTEQYGFCANESRLYSIDIVFFSIVGGLKTLL